jgi:PAS domain S-box-containing protein
VKVLDKNGCIVLMNKSGLDMLGAETFDEVEGLCVYPLVNPEYRERFQQLNARALEEGATGRMEFQTSGLKGKEIWLDAHVAPLCNADQEIIGVLGVTRDITEDKQRLERNRQQELQLIEINKMSALGTLVAGVAHEINNPNQTIQINSRLLGKVWQDTQKILDEYVATHGAIKLGGLQYSGAQGAHTDLINDIRLGADQIRTVVARLKAFARPYEGIHGSIEGAHVQLNEAVQSAVALLRHAIRTATDNFHVLLEDRLPEVQGDRQQLQQIVINLVMNALDALPDMSHGIRIETRFNASQSSVELSITDEGVGIETREMQQIMEPFYTTKREQGGTGLGLSITHSLLQEQGGSIHFESEPGKGTCVVISLPVVKH